MTDSKSFVEIKGLQNTTSQHMFDTDQYELVDAGDGRRLERFDRYLLDRPAPVAQHMHRQQPEMWQSADAHFARHTAAKGIWTHHSSMPEHWQIRHESIVLELKCTPSGAVGVYPEQAGNWDWLDRQIRDAHRSLKVLNLFGYTGGSTLTAAAAGAHVVHVDAARSAVQWARRNAHLSELETAPIRWITEDARKFAQREVRRGSQYDAVILDPPTYGHGPKSEPWKLTEHLEDLLRTVGALTRQSRAFILLTCHAPGMVPSELAGMFSRILFGRQSIQVESKRLFLRCPDGRRLASGVVARWSHD